VLIVNVYNLRGNGLRINAWTVLEIALGEAVREVILLRDFNAYYLA
jgi:hypothetical protein